MSKIIKECPVCESKDIGSLLINYKFCNSCKTAWLVKTPKTKYSKDYYKARLGFISSLFLPIEKSLYFLRSIYSGTDRKKLWIDVGAGEGKFLETVNANKKIGVEISKAGRDLMKEKGIETLTEKEFLKKRNLKAGIISFWQVLEHIKNPEKYLKIASLNISKKGLLVIGIPNIDSFDFKIFKKDWFHLAPEHHLWHFSPKSMRILLERNNFDILFVDYFAPEHHLTGDIQSFINKSSGSYNLLHNLIKRNTSTQKITLKNIFWIVFWLSFGFPVIVVFWLISSIFNKSGTIVLIARSKDK